MVSVRTFAVTYDHILCMLANHLTLMTPGLSKDILCHLWSYKFLWLQTPDQTSGHPINRKSQHKSQRFPSFLKSQRQYSWSITKEQGCFVSGRYSIFLPKLPKMPCLCYSNGSGNLENVGSNNEILCKQWLFYNLDLISPGTHMFWNCESQMMTNESHIIRTISNALPDPQTNINWK